jgi:hypothetical protein
MNFSATKRARRSNAILASQSEPLVAFSFSRRSNLLGDPYWARATSAQRAIEYAILRRFELFPTAKWHPLPQVRRVTREAPFR